MNATFEPLAKISGSLRPPGDKSISHRALILAAMTSGPCRIYGVAPGEDVAATVGCLETLGYRFSTSDVREHGLDLTVTGDGWNPKAEAKLSAGNSGTTARLLAGALSGTSGQYQISGDASLSRRPMGRVAEPLRLMGADIRLAPGDRPPVTIIGAGLRGVEYRLPVASAQVKGAVLLAALQADATTKVLERLSSRDHTERLLEWLGAPIEWAEGSIELDGSDSIFASPGFDMTVPGDLSSAAYLVTAAGLSRGGRIDVNHVGLNPSRTGLIEILVQMGAQIETDPGPGDPEPWGTLSASSSRLKAVEVGGKLVPRSIDELPLVALAATQATGTTVIRDAAELRVKESDRIKVLAEGLRQVGASVEEFADGMAVEGPTPLKGGRVDPCGDHRIALTFAVAGTIAAGPVEVLDWECTAISYPGFVADLQRLAS